MEANMKLARFAWRDALAERDIIEGAVFCSFDRHGNIKGRLSDKSVALVVKKYARQVGLDASQFAGHSLRSGFAVTAAQHGATDREIMWQTGHKSRVMVDRYVRRAKPVQAKRCYEVGVVNRIVVYKRSFERSFVGSF